MSANLAKVQTPFGARRRGSANRDYTLPPRRDTDAPGLEVNAPIIRPAGDKADELRRLLGLATETALSAAGYEMDRRNARDMGQGVLDAGINSPDDERFKKSKAYRQAYMLEGARRGAFQLDAELSDLVQDRLADEDNPATLGDIESLIETRFRTFAQSPDGKARDFGSPAASLAVAQQLTETRKKLMGFAGDTIRAQTNGRTLNIIAKNAMDELLQGPIPTVDGAPPTLATIMSDVEKRAPVEAASLSQRDVVVARPTGRLPVRGAVTSRFGRRTAPTDGATTEHRAIDIAAKRGTPVEAPAIGRVVQVGHDEASGNFVILSHGVDGRGKEVRTSYAHLDTVDVKEGDVLQPGAKFAKVGKTGRATGPHLHYKVTVGGSAIDPRGYSFDEVGGPTGDAQREPISPVDAVKPRGPEATPLPFEAVMARVPTTIPRADAKKYLLQAFLNSADEHRKPEWLEGLWRSTRTDGSPSFSPDEIKLIRGTAESLREKMRTEAKRAQEDRYEANEEVLMSAMAQGNTPSFATIRAFERDDRVSGRFAAALIDHIEADRDREEAEAKAALREERAEARQRQSDEDVELDMEWSSEAELRRSGVLTSSGLAEDQKRLDSGELGSGKRAIARYKMLRAAARQGENLLLSNPEVVQFAKKIAQLYAPGRSGGDSRVALVRTDGGKPYDYSGPILAEYNRRVKAGEAPALAYEGAVAAYGPKKDERKDGKRDPRAVRLEQLRNKQNGR